MCVPLPPPVMPMSVSRASPGPLTTQPSTESGDGEEHVGRLHRHLIVVEIVVLEDADMVERAFDQRFGTRLAVFFEQVLLEAAGVDADADRTAVGAGRRNHFLDPAFGPDVAGV